MIAFLVAFGFVGLGPVLCFARSRYVVTPKHKASTSSPVIACKVIEVRPFGPVARWGLGWDELPESSIVCDMQALFQKLTIRFRKTLLPSSFVGRNQIYLGHDHTKRVGVGCKRSRHWCLIRRRGNGDDYSWFYVGCSTFGGTSTSKEGHQQRCSVHGTGRGHPSAFAHPLRQA